MCNAQENYCGDLVLQSANGESCDGSGQAQCSVGQSCNTSSCQCISLPPGVCGTANGKTYYAFGDNGTALTATASGLCPV